MLQCRDLGKDYVGERGTVAAVTGIDLDVAAGRFAAIIGRSFQHSGIRSLEFT